MQLPSVISLVFLIGTLKLADHHQNCVPVHGKQEEDMNGKQFPFIYFIFSSFVKKYFDYAITVVPFPPFIPLYPEYPLHSHSSPLVHVRGSYIYKFFSFYISYTILNLPLSIFYLPFMLLILCTFSPSLPLPLSC